MTDELHHIYNRSNELSGQGLIHKRPLSSKPLCEQADEAERCKILWSKAIYQLVKWKDLKSKSKWGGNLSRDAEREINTSMCSETDLENLNLARKIFAENDLIGMEIKCLM